MQGLIFIPDISGFTNFVNSVNIDLGVSVTKDLLNEIINSNPLDVELSEIEGDAILYYKEGQPIPMDKIFEGYKSISTAFDSKFSSLKMLYNIEAPLSLKFILHYGNLNEYDINGFKHLYGETVIEAHRLLKNGCGRSTYILVTNDYLNALQQTTPDNLLDNKEFSYFCSDFSTGLRKVNYYFFSYLPSKKNENCFVRA